MKPCSEIAWNALAATLGCAVKGQRTHRTLERTKGCIKIVGRTFLLAAAVLAMSYVLNLPSLAQLEEVEGLNKRIIELSQAKKFAEAIPLAVRVLVIRERTLGLEHLDVATALNTLAELYVNDLRHVEAEPLYRRSLAIQEKALGPNHPSVAKIREQLLLLPNPPAANVGGASRPPSIAAAPPPPPAPPASASRSPSVGATPTAPSLNTRSGGTRGAPPTSSNSSPPSGSSAAAPASLPDFPWPPPAWSARYVLDRSLFQNRKTIGEVANAIVFALERTGYVDRSFFRTQADGVALVTQLERINDDGTARAGGDRWPTALSQSANDLTGYLKGLFFVDRGRYRVIVFVLQERPFSQSSNSVTGTEARTWLRTGVNILPTEIASRPYGDSTCSVLIYEFESEGKDAKIVDSRLTGKQHLEKSGVMTLLEKAN